MKTNKILFSCVLTFSFLLLSFSFSHATIRYVSKTGLSIPPYTSWLTAADSIQECINVSVFGDTIYVANGVYEEQVVMIPGLSLFGSGMDSCVINGSSLAYTGYHTVEVVDSCVFRGFKVIAYYSSDVGTAISGSGNSLIHLNKATSAIVGILAGPDVFVYMNICTSNRIGISISSSSSVVRKNYINVDYNIGEGIQIIGSSLNYFPLIDSNYIETIANGIAHSFQTNPTIRNNIIILKGNNAIGFHASYADSIIFKNNLIIGNNAYSGINNVIIPTQTTGNELFGNFSVGAIDIENLNIILNNNVVNGTKGIIQDPGDTPIVQYNNSWNNTVNYGGFSPDSTNLSVNPMIVNDDTTQGDLDFHLQMYSPLIDAGDPTILDKDSTRSDIGLYGGPYGESYVYLDLPPRPPRNLSVEVDSLIKLRWNKNTEADFNYYNLYRDTVSNFTVDSTKLVVSITDSFYLHLIPTNVESLYFKLTAVDNQGNESNPSEEVSVILVSVKGEWQAVNNYILYQNYPNPFNPSTKIGYKLKERGYVKLYVYDIKGELVSVLTNQTQEAGYYEVEFNVGQESLPVISSGVYIYQIMVRNERDIPVFSDIKKMVYIK